MDARMGTIRRKPVPAVLRTNMLGETMPMVNPAPRTDATAKERPTPTKRLSRRLTKRVSLPAPASKMKGKSSSMTSTFSLPIFPRSSSAPSSSTTTISVPSSPVLSTTTVPEKFPPNLPTTTHTVYDPLENYIPCLFPTCRSHYLLSTLGPTFYLPSPPYQLPRKKGLCMTHAGKELRQVNEQCKKQFENMRQNAGRKNIGIIDAEFEIWLTQFRSIRAEEMCEFEEGLKARVVGIAKKKGPKEKKPTGGERGEENRNGDRDWIYWDWKYTPRRCTKSACTSDRYSPYDHHFYLWYHTPRITGLSALQTLCPPCARRDVEEAERKRNQAWQDMHPQEWREWMERLKRNRIREQEFWEKAQESRVRERGPQENADGKKEEGKEEKGGNLLEDMCVVM